MQHRKAQHPFSLTIRLAASLILLGCSLTAPADEQAAIVTLDRLVDASYQPGATNEHYRMPEMAELLAWEQLFSHLLDKALVPDATIFPEQQRRAADLGFELAPVTLGDETCWVLSEPTVRGGGLYLIRVGAAAPLFVQAPHVRNDKHSERCTVRAFVASEARAAAFSTISRHTIKPDPGKRYGDADMSHQERSYLTSATRAAARTLGDTVVLQFHGFGQEGRGLGPRSLILSNGTRRPDALQLALGRQLVERWKPLVLLIYPDDISVLGGLLNAQGRVLLRYPQHSFLHLEMSLQLRQELLAGEPSNFDLREVLTPAAVP